MPRARTFVALIGAAAPRRRHRRPRPLRSASLSCLCPRKERYEAMMAQVERDIEKIAGRPFVFVQQ